MSPRTPVVVAARRTPVATAGRGLAGLEVTGLAAPVLAALADDLATVFPPARGDAGTGSITMVRTGTMSGDRGRIDEVVLGNCCGPGGDIARVAVLAAGLGVEVPATTVDRQCGSGLEAVRVAAALVGSGTARTVLAGGAESASTAPWRLARPHNAAEPPRPYQRAPFAPSGFADPEMGAAADRVARRCGISRERQDEYAARSHARAVAAAAEGRFDAEIVPVAGMVDDDRPRPGLSAAVLHRFRPAFGEDGTATAGNSCGINDGAAAVAVLPESARAAAGLPGLRILGTAVAGVDPAMPGLGPVPAVQQVLQRAGLTVADLAVLEVTEAFAAQVLACTDALGLDPLGADADRVCPDGGAIALGHPWGASGALLMVRLFGSLLRPPGRAGRYGVATCAIGGGQGIAVLVEAVPGDSVPGRQTPDSVVSR
jgi:acetyl-CoA C-acetyltransferase